MMNHAYKTWLNVKGPFRHPLGSWQSFHCANRCGVCLCTMTLQVTWPPVISLFLFRQRAASARARSSKSSRSLIGETALSTKAFRRWVLRFFHVILVWRCPLTLSTTRLLLVSPNLFFNFDLWFYIFTLIINWSLTTFSSFVFVLSFRPCSSIVRSLINETLMKSLSFPESNIICRYGIRNSFFLNRSDVRVHEDTWRHLALIQKALFDLKTKPVINVSPTLDCGLKWRNIDSSFTNYNLFIVSFSLLRNENSTTIKYLKILVLLPLVFLMLLFSLHTYYFSVFVNFLLFITAPFFIFVSSYVIYLFLIFH